MSASERHVDILVARKGGHQVTVTHAKAGTVLVSGRGYGVFRRIIIAREVIGQRDAQSEAILELMACFEAAELLGRRHHTGALLLLDRETQIMFLVDPVRRILTYAIDRRVVSRERSQRKRAAADPVQNP